MKKLLILALTVAIAFGANAQESQSFANKLARKLYLNASTEAVSQNKGYTDYGATFQIGYKITPQFFAFVSCNGGLTLYDKDGLKDQLRQTNLGGGLGYRFITNSEKNSGLDLKATVTTTVGSPDWKSTTYDAGLFYRFPNRGLAPQLGLGYRFSDSRTAGVKSHGGLYASIGFSF